MKIWRVEMEEILTWSIEVEAETAEEAREQASLETENEALVLESSEWTDKEEWNVEEHEPLSE